MKKTLQNTGITEARRYLANAKEILKTKGGNGVPGYYSDPKYVKMACNTAWSGVLVALDSKVDSTQIDSPQAISSKKKRKSVDTYKQYLTTRNKKALNDFNSAYNYLHLFGGYDGDLNKKTAQTGLELAENIITWCAQTVSQKPRRPACDTVGHIVCQN